MNDVRRYEVGGHGFTLDIETGMLSEKELTAYAPFRTVCLSGENNIFTLKVRSEMPESEEEECARFEDENGRMTLFRTGEGGMAVRLRTRAGNECCHLMISADYRNATARIEGTAGERRYGFDTATMLLYAFNTATLDTLLVHASAVEEGGRGYIFLGKSGTGKSTHSRLWTECIEGVTLLNDDNPVVRVGEDGTVEVYGSPWSGKTPCYLNRSVRIGGIVRLRQAGENRIRKLTGVKAYAALLPSCSCMKWDREMAEGVHRTVSKVTESTGVYELECRADECAARLCKETIVTGDAT
ncbi:MAG: hypothetical protein K2M04_00105 [Muribaculaceae bacterium]|nr:hypothetical protein [Muribaculaceae bacterium]